MKDLIWEWRYVIILAIIFGLYTILEWSNVKGQILAAIVAAKDLAKDKVLHGGKAQEDWVVSRVYIIIPARVKLILSEEILRKIIRYLYKKAMDLLDDGKANDSYPSKEDEEKEQLEE